MSPNFTDVCMVGAGHKLAVPPSPPSTYKSLSILATLQSYIFAPLRSITFSFGNFKATEIKIKLLLVLDMSEAVTDKVSPSSTAVTLLR